jgi:hypothetical protein
MTSCPLRAAETRGEPQDMSASGRVTFSIVTARARLEKAFPR